MNGKVVPEKQIQNICNQIVNPSENVESVPCNLAFLYPQLRTQ